MLVGHFAVGLAGKRVEAIISLGTLVLASRMADLLWFVEALPLQSEAGSSSRPMPIQSDSRH